MKDYKLYRIWMQKAIELKLTFKELRVFIIWFDDAPNFSAGAQRIHELIPSMRRQHISSALKGIHKKGLFKKSGTHRNFQGSPTPLYELNYEILSVQDRESLSIPDSDTLSEPNLDTFNTSVPISADKCPDLGIQVSRFDSTSVPNRDTYLLKPIKTSEKLSKDFFLEPSASKPKELSKEEREAAIAELQKMNLRTSPEALVEMFRPKRDTDQ